MQLIELVKAGRIIESLQQESVEIGLAYKMMKFLKDTKDDISFYDNKARELVEKYALRDEEGKPVMQGGNIRLDMDRKDEFDKEVLELNTTEVNCPEVKFNIQEFEGIRLSVVSLMALDNFISKEE